MSQIMAPGLTPAMLRRWAQVIEGRGFDLLMVSAHVAITSDVTAKYPTPFYEPFTTLSFLAAVTDRIHPIADADRLAGEGTIDQVTADLESLRLVGADTVVLDPFIDHCAPNLRPDSSWNALATLAVS